MIGIYVPSYGRPGSLQRFADNVKATTTVPYRVVFVVEPDDPLSLDAAKATGEKVLVNHGVSGYADSTQTAFDDGDEEFFVNANDDFDFQPGWAEAALEKMQPGVEVVGINDGVPASACETIMLTRRSYIEESSGVIDIPRRVFYPYYHNFVDTEFAKTAQARGVWVPCFESAIIHKHPDFGLSEWDDTYARSRVHFNTDATTYGVRRHLWENLGS